MRNYLVAFLLLISTVSTLAQETNGAVSGAVTDSSGALVPGTSVTILNADTNVKAWAGKTNQVGAYIAPVVPVGVYNITFEAPGLRKFEVQRLTLKIDQRARVDAVLAPGDVKETITVTGESVAILNRDDTSLGLQVDPSQIRDIPLAGRDIMNLLNLSGGVSAGGDATAINGAQYSINGARTQATQISVDGASVIGGSTGSANYMPPIEAVREVKILTSTYPAEYGRSAGASISMVIDSGTNRYHGGIYDYFRNEDLNANNFFNNLRGQPRPYSRVNQFGAKLGGPVFLPKLYRGKDRTFFFLNYSGSRSLSSATNISTLPDAAFRSGNFSASPVAVGDPLTSASARTPFAGNIIPASRFDAAAVKTLALIPLPNSPGTLDTATGRRNNNYVNTVATVPANDDVTTRVDHNISVGNRLSGGFTHSWSVTPMAEVVAGPLNPGTGDRKGGAYRANIALTSTLTPRLILELRGSYARGLVDQKAPAQGTDQKTLLGIQRNPLDAPPNLLITGYTSLGTVGNTLSKLIDNVFQFSPTFSWVHAGHTVKGGVQVRKNQYNFYNPNTGFAGQYSFTGEISAPNTTGGNPIQAYADFLMGEVKSATYNLPQPMIGRRNYNLAFHIQDDWKVSRNLTLNLGLREEYESPMTTSNHMYSRVDVNTGQMLVAGKNASESLNLDPPKLNFGPRIGIAYSVNGKTVIRSAFGVFFYQLFSNLGGVVPFPGYTVTQQYNSLGRGVPQQFTYTQGMPLPLVQNFDPLAVAKAATTSNPLSPGIQYAETDHLPENLQWNFGIQREIASHTVLEARYVGSHAYHLPLFIRVNTLPSFAVAEQITASGVNVNTQLLRQFPTVNGWTALRNTGISAYHSLQLAASREFTRSVSFTANYTFAKATDNGSGTFDNTQPSGRVDGGQVPQLARQLDHSLSAFDRTHSLVVTPRYSIQSGPRWTRDIDFTAVFVARSGLPANIYQSNLFPDAVEQRPNITGPASLLYAPQHVAAGTAIQYLRPTSDPQSPLLPTGPLFATINGAQKMLLPASIGNLGRYTIRTPADWNMNLSMGKRVRVMEKLTLTLRAESFNLFNHTSLGFPSTSLGVAADTVRQTAVFNSPGYGLITSARASRFNQLIARIEF